ncbi:MAG: hypothetical protein HZB51_15045 [Chloroflexi bacterium]|nr:hypothetical protein [Chloroflexota bacterium]
MVKGRPLFDGGIFLAFYFNQITATQAFALIKGTDRIWGIDFDTFRGWHLHPVEKPQDHVTIQAQDIPTIIEKLGNVIATLTTK